jgi:hypothetical protein
MSSSSSETPNCEFSNLVAFVLGSTTQFFFLLLGLVSFGMLTYELYETANARRLSRDPSKTIIQGQVKSVEVILGRTVGEDSNNQLVYLITYEYIPMVWPQEADALIVNLMDTMIHCLMQSSVCYYPSPFSVAEVRVQRKFTSGRNGQYQAGQDIDVQILPRDPMSGRVAEELLNYKADKCPKAFGFLKVGLLAFVFVTFGFWVSLQDILQDGCRKNAVVFLFVAYVLYPGLLVLYLVCLCGYRWKDLKWSDFMSTLIVVEHQENQMEEEMTCYTSSESEHTNELMDVLLLKGKSNKINGRMNRVNK